ncbi:hypothetical protein B2J93_2480 [Marssonina coronariae]|uniref:Uncharacterized protein n=1 Tax=Diplocarpon coronariae TaxID=2795749 RepID=A0A218YSY9_9HELO|nr:hypothetical protein B2J93_2480 [Marssonina coronariae]
MENLHLSNFIPRLGPRIPAPLKAVGGLDSIMNILPDRVLEARADSTSSAAATSGSCGENACEKPVGSSTYTIPIILGIAVPVVGAAVTFLILHRRHVRRQAREDANDIHASMDFGLGNVPNAGKSKNKGPNVAAMDFGDEKPGGISRRQVSMDLAVNSPYLLPPELQNSRESIHSLSRTLHVQEDPYGPVKEYHPGDTMSVGSQSKKGSSIYTGSSKAPSRFQDNAASNLLSNAGQMARNQPPSAAFPARQNSLPPGNASFGSTEQSADSLGRPLPAEPAQAHIAGSSSDLQRNGISAVPRLGQGPGSADDMGSFGKDSNGFGMVANGRQPSPGPSQQGLPVNAARKPPPAPINTHFSNSPPARKDSIPIVQPQQAYIEDAGQYGEGFQVTPPSPGIGNSDATRGQRYSMDVPPDQFAQAGLGAPGFDAKRLSMGFRPLPPAAETDSEDPESRANRIRSFYKEYFDDSKPAPKGQYYEDYDENYPGDSNYFDPHSNAFVMPMPRQPYAEPMTRRAMTPPPRGPPRFQGQGQPRVRQGSVGAMSAGGMRGPPGPRAHSSASGRMGPVGPPRRPHPPPADLNTMPAPSKLKDDSFALFNAIDFAPPSKARDRVAGRSESPFGEKRPYSPMVPAFTPSVSAFEELAPMPSPHLLRNSGTFTSLDFAAPRKFRDPENMSDAGSIRSNRSGISQIQHNAIRNGAYRVSKIPTDVVFTKDDLSTTLKPQWGMRSGA